jgi:hypothetical protein
VAGQSTEDNGFRLASIACDVIEATCFRKPATSSWFLDFSISTPTAPDEGSSVHFERSPPTQSGMGDPVIRKDIFFTRSLAIGL